MNMNYATPNSYNNLVPAMPLLQPPADLQLYFNLPFEQNSLQAKVVHQALQKGTIKPNTPEYNSYISSLSGEPLQLNAAETRTEQLLDIYKSLRSQPLQKDFFKYLYEDIQINPNNLPKTEILLPFLSSLYQNTNEQMIKDTIANWFKANKVVFNNQALQIFSSSERHLLHKLPAKIQQKISPISHLCENVLAKMTPDIFPEVLFVTNPTTILKELMDEYAYLMRNTAYPTTERSLYSESLVNRATQLFLTYPAKTRQLFFNQAMFNSPINLSFYKNFLETMVSQTAYIFENQIDINSSDSFNEIEPFQDADLGRLIRFARSINGYENSGRNSFQLQESLFNNATIFPSSHSLCVKSTPRAISSH